MLSSLHLFYIFAAHNTVFVFSLEKRLLGASTVSASEVWVRAGSEGFPTSV